MRKRYADADHEIRAILQHNPRLTAKELWNELTVWPIPSIRTIHRVAQGVKRDLAVGPDLAAIGRNRKTKLDIVERPDGFSKEFSNMAAEDKLDQIISHLDGLHKRLDAIEAEHATDRKEHADWRAQAQAHADADAKEKEKADAAAAAAKGATRADATNENRSAFAGAQMRLDSATQAWGNQCRAPLAGESLRDYRINVLNGLKQHSRAYKDSDLTTIGDEAAFSNIEGIIINDAIEASTNNVVHGAPLRSVTKMNEMGQRVTSWYGDPGVTWGPFAGGHTRFGKIVRPANA